MTVRPLKGDGPLDEADDDKKNSNDDRADDGAADQDQQRADDLGRALLHLEGLGVEGIVPPGQCAQEPALAPKGIR